MLSRARPHRLFRLFSSKKPHILNESDFAIDDIITEDDKKRAEEAKKAKEAKLLTKEELDEAINLIPDKRYSVMEITEAARS